MKPEQTIQFLAELLELAEELNRIVKQYCRLVTTDQSGHGHYAEKKDSASIKPGTIALVIKIYFFLDGEVFSLTRGLLMGDPQSPTLSVTTQPPKTRYPIFSFTQA
jgi:hypothetical protein